MPTRHLWLKLAFREVPTTHLYVEWLLLEMQQWEEGGKKASIYMKMLEYSSFIQINFLNWLNWKGIDSNGMFSESELM